MPVALGPVLLATLLVAAADSRAVLLDPGDCRDVLAVSGRRLPQAVRVRVKACAGEERVARLDATACRAVLKASCGRVLQ